MCQIVKFAINAEPLTKSQLVAATIAQNCEMQNHQVNKLGLVPRATSRLAFSGGSSNKLSAHLRCSNKLMLCGQGNHSTNLRQLQGAVRSCGLWVVMRWASALCRVCGDLPTNVINFPVSLTTT